MRLYSTQTPSHQVSLKEAVMRGLPPDNGLYMPLEIPQLPADFWTSAPSLTFPELSFQVAHALLGAALPEAVLYDIVTKAISFDTPIVSIEDQTGILELFHGPTLAFKDVGARFMGNLMSYYNQDEKRPLTILVATSGDTGGAVANGFYKKEGIEVVILYPKGKVSPIQERQLTTLGENVQALAIEGTFDDCQAMVKKAFLDDTLAQHRRLTSANSINISRLIPQSFYYFRAWQQAEDQPLTFIVPSGNFGNLTGGLFAWKMGLPVQKFIAATNINDTVPAYLASGDYQPKASIQTYANAMDVGNPSNFVRMQALFGGKTEEMKKMILGAYFDDVQILDAIQHVHQASAYELDPHTAIGYLAWQSLKEAHNLHQGIILGTAHPAKFQPVMKKALGREVTLPSGLAHLMDKTPAYQTLPADFQVLKDFLLSHS